MKLTKIKIEEMVKEIIDYLKANDLYNDVSIYFNNKRISFYNEWDKILQVVIPYTKVEEDMNPLDYFEYANPKHILSMSFEGALYHLLNYDGNTDKFDAIFHKYGLYYEQGDAWNLTAYPDTIDYDDIEYTSYGKEPEPTVIYSHSTDVPKELIIIKHMWDRLSETTKHLGGSCTIDDGFEFQYNGTHYFMVTPFYQGSMIYEHWINVITHELEVIGATDIHYNYGHID